MTWPTWFEAGALALSGYYVFYLLSESVLLERPREWVLTRLDSDAAEAFVVCPWCLGFWVALAEWGAWLAFGEWAVVAVVPFALACAIGLLHGET